MDRTVTSPVLPARFVVLYAEMYLITYSACLARSFATPHPQHGRNLPMESLKSYEYNYLCKRSEEHTSELQSLMRISYAVFCLQKKKKKENNKLNTTQQNACHQSVQQINNIQ